MLRRRVTVLEFLLLVAILGLACAIPIQFYRAVREGDYRLSAEYHTDCANRFEKMASHPAAWMTEFRPQLERLAAWEHWQSQRLSRLAAYEDAAERRLAEEVFPGAERQKFWLRFNSVAALNGYNPPPLMRQRNRPDPAGAIVERCSPTISVLAVLALLLFWMRSRHRRLGRSLHSHTHFDSGFL